MTASNPNYSSTLSPAQQPGGGWRLGRVGRLGFMLGLLYATSVFFVCAGLMLAVSFVTGVSPYSSEADIMLYNNVNTALDVIARILFAIAVMTLAIRRLHDVEFSGWVLLLALIPLVNLALIGCLLLAPSKEPNKYGPPLMSLNFWSVLGFK